MTVALVVGIIVVLVVVVVVVSRRRSDPVDSFRRQIDALSPEARRPTIDRLKATEDDDGAGTDEATGTDDQSGRDDDGGRDGT